MAVYAPILNPVRFYDPTRLPDYADRWPTMDNVSAFVEWQKGIFASKFYRDFVLDQTLPLQFRFDSGVADPEIFVYKLNTSDGSYAISETLVPTNVTPSGWSGANIYNYEWSPTSTGVYYLDFDGADLISDKIVVHNDPKYLSRLIKLEYYHYENKYDMLYFRNGSPVYQGLTFLQGALMAGEPSNEISAFIDDPGTVELLSATPQRSATLALYQLHYTYVDFVNLVFSNSEIFINNIQYQNQEAPTVERISGSDLVNMEIKVFQKVDNFFIT